MASVNPYSNARSSTAQRCVATCRREEYRPGGFTLTARSSPCFSSFRSGELLTFGGYDGDKYWDTLLSFDAGIVRARAQRDSRVCERALVADLGPYSTCAS